MLYSDIHPVVRHACGTFEAMRRANFQTHEIEFRIERGGLWVRLVIGGMAKLTLRICGSNLDQSEFDQLWREIHYALPDIEPETWARMFEESPLISMPHMDELFTAGLIQTNLAHRVFMPSDHEAVLN